MLPVGQVRQVTDESLSGGKLLGRKFLIKEVWQGMSDHLGDEHEMTFMTIVWEDGSEAVHSYHFIDRVSVEV